MEGDGSDVPKEVKVESDGFICTIPVWCEIPVQVEAIDHTDGDFPDLSKENRTIDLSKELGLARSMRKILVLCLC